MNYQGVVIGLSVFLIIGLFHPIVIKGEYYFSKKIWPLFLVCGAGLVAGSLFIENFMISTLLCVVGFSCFWSIHELFVQEKRVERGWFPQNPKRKSDAKTGAECAKGFIGCHHHARKAHKNNIEADAGK